jgi:hypothetical protein
MDEMINSYIFVRKPEGKGPLGRPRHRWKDIGMDLREIWWEDADWMHLVQDGDQCQALVNTVMDLQVLKGTGNFLTS